MSEEVLAGFAPPVRRPLLPESDVSYAAHDSAVGRLLLAVGPDGRLLLSAYATDDAAESALLQRVADMVSPRVLRQARPLDVARREIDEFVAGRRREFGVPVNVALASDFQRAVLGALRAGVGYGEVTSYAALAAAAVPTGARAARAVGSALGSNPLCIVIPCHRVLPAASVAAGLGAAGLGAAGLGGAASVSDDGPRERSVGGYAGGAEAKRFLLQVEAGGTRTR